MIGPMTAKRTLPTQAHRPATVLHPMAALWMSLSWFMLARMTGTHGLLQRMHSGIGPPAQDRQWLRTRLGSLRKAAQLQIWTTTAAGFKGRSRCLLELRLEQPGRLLHTMLMERTTPGQL